MKIKHFKSGKDKGILEDDHGVSPVIAVILMVAITVVMAAIVSSWSSGVKAPTTPTTVGMDISRDNTNITAVVTAIDPASSAPIQFINFTYQKLGVPAYDNITNADVGNSKTMDTNSATLSQFIVTATFKDGSKKVLYSRIT